ncbi:2-oxo acid dehydrogenase subunit E2 [Paenibacillus sp. N1-5-1-14]|uniref:dihydrolipoamide acetyltransferase family protein n=1 Tax=Paenibacillus radicibacter TaxID=2972488 RepID=UPI0021595A34|nr:dihydrolipoamide acetyltransferase family protein [Paenibacillus radicibacter]MCR8641813.1 2-oxo acid dehydrogenase subunit E2 [Paenibacillus radicibacter]
MVEFKLPDVGEGMHEGEISKWLVKEGDQVQKDQPIVEVQTDKVNAELSSPVTGIVKKILFAEGDTVHVGQTLFVVDDNSEVEVAAAIEVEGISWTEEKLVLGVEEDRQVVSVHALQPKLKRALATPYVRQLARELKVDIEQVTSTGPSGRITEEDVQRYAASLHQKQTVVEVEVSPIFAKQDLNEIVSEVMNHSREVEQRQPIKGIRKKIAEHMVKSVSIIPHVTHVDEIEMDGLLAMRGKLKSIAEQRSIKLTFLPFFIKALCFALKEFPQLNASIDDATNEMILKQYYHIGVATDTQDGLIVPVVKHADQKTIFQIAEEISALAAQARDGKLTLNQITGGTFTVSNVGAIGGLYATPIINHPEVGILALHKVEKRHVVRQDESVIRSMMYMSLSFDHRIIDGVMAVRFTNRIKQLLENPEMLIAEMV